VSEVGDGFLVRSLATTYGDGFVIGDHGHPWGQLVYATSGVMRVTAGETLWFTPATRAIWLPAGRPHRIVMQGQVAMRTLYLAPEIAGALPDAAVALEVAPLLREMILHVLKRGMLGPEGEQGRLAQVLVDLIVRARPQDLSLPLPADRRALILAERLQADPRDRTDLTTLAADAGASLRTLQRIFPAQTGLSLDAWRQKARLVQGAAALAAGTPVTVAALDSGYDSPSAFIAAFKRQFGVTPGRWRG